MWMLVRLMLGQTITLIEWTYLGELLAQICILLLELLDVGGDIQGW